MAKINLEDIATLKTKFDDLKQQHQVTLNQIDDLEQYGRRENLEIHGVPTMRNENTNQIIKRALNPNFLNLTIYI